MRSLLILSILFFIGGCALPPPAPEPTVRTESAREGELARMRQEQEEQGRQLQRLEDNLLLLEGRLHDTQQILHELRAAATQKVTLDRQKTASPVAPPSSGASGKSASPTELYLKSFAEYASGRCPEAISGFQEFLRLYPGNDYTSHALYWLGECFYVEQQFPAALDAFRQSAETSPQGGKAPDALLRLAQTLQKLQRDPEAAETLQRLRRQFPESAAAKQGLKSE